MHFYAGKVKKQTVSAEKSYMLSWIHIDRKGML